MCARAIAIVLPDPEYRWRSENTTVAVVSEGLVTALTPGTTTVTVYDAGTQTAALVHR